MTCVAQARKSGVGVGFVASHAESEMMAMEPVGGMGPPSPGFDVAFSTVNVNSPFGVIGQLQHSDSS